MEERLKGLSLDEMVCLVKYIVTEDAGEQLLGGSNDTAAAAAADDDDDDDDDQRLEIMALEKEAATLFDQNLLEPSRLLYEKVLRQKEALVDESYSHVDILETTQKLTLILEQLGDYDEAVKVLESGRRRWETILLEYKSEDASNQREEGFATAQTAYYRSCAELAFLIELQGVEMDRCQELLIESYEGMVKTCGKGHVDTLKVLNNLINLYITSGEYIDAKDTLFNALHGLNVTSLDDFIPTLEIMEQLGEAFMKRTQYDDAAKVFELEFEFRDRIEGISRESRLLCMARHANALMLLSKLDEAQSLYQSVVEQYAELSLDPSNADAATASAGLADVYRVQGNLKHAEFFYKKAYRSYKVALGVSDIETLRVLNEISLILYKQGRHKEGQKYFEKCLKYRDGILGPDHADSILTATNLAALLYDTHQFDRAMILYDRLCKSFQKKGKFGGSNAEKFKELYDNCQMLAKAVNIDKKEAKLARSLPVVISDRRHHHSLVKIVTGKFVCSICSDTSDGGICYFCEDCQIAVHVSCISTE